ncbi:hypothetical protein CYMTET_15686, partial [Cymbomonas tetramitiformis]
ACAGVPGVQIMCLFPKGRVSRIQELQLTTAQGDASNLHVYQTHGNTDDQAMVLKEIFSDKSFCDQHGVCSINSINVGRVVTQASYYVYAYLRAVKMGAMEMGSPAAFAVPTGAFGNCFAGYMAKQIGVPISVIVAATNANDIVHRTISRGDMRTGQNLPTLSPAMDIQVHCPFAAFSSTLLTLLLLPAAPCSSLLLPPSWLLLLRLPRGCCCCGLLLAVAAAA